MELMSDRREPVKPKLREYRLPGDWLVLVGKTEADNDILSIKVANPEDWWFHVRGFPGSHVVLRVTGKEEPDKDILKRAASVAAYHSKARTAGLVPVAATRAKYVTKPSGAKPGTVHISKEIILKVRPALPETEPDSSAANQAEN
jgi:predicted ribosome quality control (RQC) complex YloA/Tae2 family protein